MYYAAKTETPLGIVTLASDGSSLIGLWTEGQKYYGGTVEEETTEQEDLPVFVETIAWLGQYFAGERPAVHNLPLAPIGGAFRQIVWELLCDIPYGQVTTYGELAKQVAARMNKRNMSSRAVGGAVGHNPISIIIPCHRVIGTNGSYIGYAGGIDKKIKLLTLEGVDLSHMKRRPTSKST